MAIWEMTCLLIAPKKVFRSIYYHVITPTPVCIFLADGTHLETYGIQLRLFFVCFLIRDSRNEKYVAPA